MFTNILRRRVAAVLTAGAAAAAVLALAAPAGAVTGATQTSREQAGFIATGTQFKAVRADIYLRDPRPYADMVARYGHSIQLWSPDRVVSLNFTASTSGEYFTPSVTIYSRSTHQVIASNPNAQHRYYRDPTWYPGVGGPWHFDHPGYWTSLSIGYSPATGHLKMTVEPGPSLQAEIRWSYDLSGQSFTQARIGTEFGRSPFDASYSYTPPVSSVAIARYSHVGLTSYSGHTATLQSSWWVSNKMIAKPSGRAQVAGPGNRYDGGATFRTFFTPKST